MQTCPLGAHSLVRGRDDKSKHASSSHCVRSHSLCLVFTGSFHPQKWELGAITMPITRMRKLRLRQVK